MAVVPPGPSRAVCRQHGLTPIPLPQLARRGHAQGNRRALCPVRGQASERAFGHQQLRRHVLGAHHAKPVPLDLLDHLAQHVIVAAPAAEHAEQKPDTAGVRAQREQRTRPPYRPGQDNLRYIRGMETTENGADLLQRHPGVGGFADHRRVGEALEGDDEDRPAGGAAGGNHPDRQLAAAGQHAQPRPHDPAWADRSSALSRYG
jgi:hypothetical protein